MKISLERYKVGYNNSKQYLESEIKKLEVEVERVRLLSKSVVFHYHQIVEAEKRGILGFDSERFMKRRAK